MPKPLVRRLLQADIDLDLDGWVTWALKAGIRTEVIAFLNWRSQSPAEGIVDMFCTFDPAKDGPYACPGTWHAASDILDLRLPEGLELEALTGVVGKGPALELAAFVRVFRDLEPPDYILANPDKAKIPTKMDALFAICGSLARKATDGNLKRLLTYVERLPAEFAVMTRDPLLTNVRAYTEYCSKYGELLT
jgi:hypothetical protein